MLEALLKRMEAMPRRLTHVCLLDDKRWELAEEQVARGEDPTAVPAAKNSGRSAGSTRVRSLARHEGEGREHSSSMVKKQEKATCSVSNAASHR